MKNLNEYQVLIVEDENDLRDIIAQDFRKKGFKVIESVNGNDAFKIVQSEKIDIILSDIRMPNGTGIELLENIKKMNIDIPVMMFLTGGSDFSIEEAYDRGADAVFSKPFKRKTLMGAVLKALSDYNQRWSCRKTTRVTLEHLIKVQFLENKALPSGKILNLGRGGMFVVLDEQFPHVGDRVSFQFAYDQGTLVKISGTGIVRWVRDTASENFPKGCGIEFESLDENDRKNVLNLINDIKTGSFIPFR